MQAYEWAVYPYSTPTTDDLAKHSGITDSEAVAVKHVEKIMREDRACAIGTVYPASLVYSATRSLSYEWVPTENGRQRFCTRTVRGGARWLNTPVSAQLEVTA